MEDVVLKRLAACLTLLPVAAIAAPETYTVDSFHSYPNFSIERPVSTMYGRFDKMAGKVTLDRVAKSGSIDLTIEATSITTGDNDKGARGRSRDEHLRAADFFNAAEFPRLTYKSTKVAFTGDNPSAVEGNLTLLGVTKPVNLTISNFKCIPASGNNKERCGGNAVGKFKRTDFGMKYAVPTIGDEVTLMIGLEVLKD